MVSGFKHPGHLRGPSVDEQFDPRLWSGHRFEALLNGSSPLFRLRERHHRDHGKDHSDRGLAKRSGVGASLATGVVLSVLLVSNYVILVGADQREALYAKTNEESYLVDNSKVLSASEVLDLMDRAQAALSSAPIPCDAFSEALARRLDSLNVTQSAGPLSVDASVAVLGTDQSDGRFEAFGPSQSTPSGLLHLGASVFSSAKVISMGVSFAWKSFSIVTLPVKVAAISTSCRNYEQTISAALKQAETGGCNQSAIETAARDLGSNLVALSRAQGLSSSLVLGLVSGFPCSAKYTFVVSQLDIEGPLGPFTVAAEGGATVSPQG